MSDSFRVEEWNVLDSAAMAVSVESLLYRLIHGKPKPYDFDEALDRGMQFLKEAGSAGAIMCGRAETSEFHGTLSPLSWSTDAYVQIELKPKAAEREREKVDYATVTETLKQYRNLLQKVKQGQEPQSVKDEAKNAHGFFRALSVVLMSEADPTTKTYSEEARGMV
jgi:hypothetical protein